MTGNEVQAALKSDRALKKRFQHLVSLYPDRRAALIPALHAVQDKLGHLPDDAVVFVAEFFETTPADVLSVITFYDMFHRRPRGKHDIEVCRNLACKLRGADEVVERLEQKLGIRCGESTADGEFSLNTFKCLKSCTEAPIMTANWRYHRNVDPDRAENQLESKYVYNHRNVDPDRAESLIDRLKAGEVLEQEPRGEEPPPPEDSKAEIYLTKRMRAVGKGEHLRVSLEDYVATRGYEALGKALKLGREQVVETVKAANLRGRGGAGFPAGLKWSFMPKEVQGAHYLAVNADESEPGTCKDRLLMERDPHCLIEGAAIAAFAIGAEKIYIYIRGEYLYSAEVLEAAIQAATEAGYLGADVMNTGTKIECFVHRGAGAYICGEETALMESLEGKRGHPRSKPPFPAQSGLWKSPTTVNNVETLCNVPFIILNGPDWFRGLGTEKSPGNLLYTVAGRVQRPGIYELPLGTTSRYLIEECAGGMQEGCELVGFNPGGASTGFLPADKLDVPLDHDSLKAVKSMLGTGGITVVHEAFGIVPAIEAFVSFFEHETCGQCGPCREGCAWASKLVRRFLSGNARSEDLDVLIALLDSAQGRTICVYPEALSGPIRLGVEYFRSEFEALARPPELASQTAASGNQE